jgi:hypothetical protein
MAAETYAQLLQRIPISEDQLKEALIVLLTGQNRDGSPFQIPIGSSSSPDTYNSLISSTKVGLMDLLRRLALSLLSGQNPDGSAFTFPLAGIPPSGAAGGFLGGMFPNPTTAAGNTLIKNADVDAAASIVGTKLANNTITATQIANNTITATQIANNTITDAQVNAAAAIAKTKLAALNISQADMASGFRAVAVSSSAPGSPAAFDTWWDTTNKLLNVRDSGNANWITITPVAATVTTSETTTSTSYTDLATPGPSVTVNTGTAVVVTIGCESGGSSGLEQNSMAVNVSGATSITARDQERVLFNTANTNPWGAFSKTSYLTGLTAGSNTFKAVFKVNAGTGTFLNRNIVVQAIPT